MTRRLILTVLASGGAGAALTIAAGIILTAWDWQRSARRAQQRGHALHRNTF